MAACAAVRVGGLAHSVLAQTGPFDGIALGAACTASTACAQVQRCNVPGLVVCADNGIIEDGRLTCCLNDEGFCFTDADCCVGLACVARDGDACGAGRCTRPPRASASAGCAAYLATMLAQLPRRSVYSILSTWGQSTPKLFGLPAHCPWPVLPPETPWCTPDFCVEDIPLEHSDDGQEYCYWYDPDLAGEPEDSTETPQRRAKWRCGSLDLIAGTP
jgi:hypothetical protein